MQEDNSEKVLVETLTVGHVVKGIFYNDGCFVAKNGTSREKLFVILGRDKEGHFFGLGMINSEARTKFEAADYQYKLLKEKNSFLDHDSFVDCSYIWERSIEDVESYACDPRRLKGKLSDNDLDVILSIIIQADTIPLIDLKRFGLI